MRRDMDLIRRILIMVGDSPVPLQATVFVDDMHPFETVAYHIDLIGQAHLGVPRKRGDDPVPSPLSSSAALCSPQARG